MLQTLQKAVEVLNLFSPAHPEWTVGDIARALEQPKSSTSELLSSMAGQGLLRRTGPGRYRLGWRLLEFGQTLLKTTEFRTEARQVMEEVVARWGETMHLAVLENGQVIYVEKLEGTHAVHISLSGVGARLPAHCSGVGKVLLAHALWSEVAQILEQQGMHAFTSHTITTPEDLARELELVRQRGYACDQEEVSIGLCCVAAPIYNFEGRVIAAMSISLPTHRFQAQRASYVGLIVEAAQRVSENLGYHRGMPRWAMKR